MRLVSIEFFLKWVVSRTEEAQYCQPCGHSPGSRVSLCGGRLPACNSAHAGRHQNPFWSNSVAAACNSPKHPSAGSSWPSLRTTSSATSGVLSLERTSQLNATPDLPSESEAWPVDDSLSLLSRLLLGVRPATHWLLPRSLRRGSDNARQRTLVALCASCGWLWDWRSGTRSARRTAGLAPWRWLPTRMRSSFVLLRDSTRLPHVFLKLPDVPDVNCVQNSFLNPTTEMRSPPGPHESLPVHPLFEIFP